MPSGEYFHKHMYGESNPAKNPEVAKKISNSLKGRIRSEEHNKRLSDSLKKGYAEGRIISYQKGKPLTQETKNKLRIAHLGKKLSEETKRKLSIIGKGRPHSELHKKRLSEARKRGLAEGRIIPWNKGIPCSEELKEKISKANKGKIKSKEHIEKLSQALKGRNPPNKGKKMSTKTCESISLTKKGLNFKKKEIIDLYVNEEQSTRDIGKIFNCSKTAIRYLLLKEGIELRTIATPAQMRKISLKLKNQIRSLEVRQRMSASKQGVSMDNWERFVSREPYSQNWSLPLKKAIRKRDNQVCMCCGIHREKLNKSLDVHHVNYDKQISIPENLISLCRGCHIKMNKNRDSWTLFLQSILSKKYGYEYDEENKPIIQKEFIIGGVS